MLTRLTRIDDIAPDVSVYPSARDPRTGGRQLEELAFEIASTESLGHAGKRAMKLITRGVRRVFAIDVERARVLEWSSGLGQWSILDLTVAIEDKALAVPLPTVALVEAARADDALANALRAKRHPAFDTEREIGRAEGRAEGRDEGRADGFVEGLALAVTAVLASRGLELSPEQHARIRAERDRARLEGWLAAAATCDSVESLLRA